LALAISGRRNAAAASAAEIVEMLPAGRNRSSRSIVLRVATAKPTRALGSAKAFERVRTTTRAG
jgi:hypothetical protein